MSIRDKISRKECWDSTRSLLGMFRPRKHIKGPMHRTKKVVKHFDRKREYLQFKEKIYAVGLIDVTPSCSAINDSLTKRHRRVYRSLVAS
ncbi:hypothetical protein Anas_01601 [Armadillidium nasatum]|uniref:Uncharacterized protein n=1 Tax=Armadillidium nasatum TaxID=96803 RepID=A0A5N5SLK3_9CRUS|nr:hypothetical protein Anas_01601 [Armadillidium nasatum]